MEIFLKGLRAQCQQFLKNLAGGYSLSVCFDRIDFLLEFCPLHKAAMVRQLCLKFASSFILAFSPAIGVMHLSFDFAKLLLL
jgi:hypothetical protein